MFQLPDRLRPTGRGVIESIVASIIVGIPGVILAATTAWVAAPTSDEGWVRYFLISLIVFAVAWVLFAIGWRWMLPLPEQPAAPQQPSLAGFRGDPRLRLRFFGDARTPIQVQQANIWRWYSLAMIQRIITADGQARDSAITTLFVMLDQPIHDITQVLVSSPDFNLPEHEVKDWGPRHAIIAFSGRLPDGELEVRIPRT